MNKSYLLYGLLLIIIFQTSCMNTKQITMFQDIEENLILSGVPREVPIYNIKPFDNLYLSIKTLDPEVNQLFNPSADGGGGFGGSTSMQYGSPESQYINGYMVQADGYINLPILGQVKVTGLSLEEAENFVKEKAEEYLKEPTVKVKVLNFKVNVTGEVKNPGLYYNYEGKLNILDALSMANGITEYANLKKGLVIRHNENNSKTYNIDFTDRSIYYSEAFYLQPGDLVYVKPHKNKRTRENATTYSLFLSTITTLFLITNFVLNN